MLVSRKEQISSLLLQNNGAESIQPVLILGLSFVASLICFPLQHAFLEKSMDRGAWQTTVHQVAKSWTWLSD